jgi:hypothetical protein
MDRRHSWWFLWSMLSLALEIRPSQDKEMSRSRVSQIKSVMWFGAILFALAICAPASAQITIQIGGPQVFEW